MKRFLIILISALLLPTAVGAAVLDNVGFVQKNIWYSKDPFYEGDNITIYTVVFNSGEEEVEGEVQFFDKDILLGETDFVVEPGQFQDISIGWDVAAGDHVISAKIVEARVVTPEGESEPTQLKYTQTDEDRKFVPKKIVEIEKIKEEVEEAKEFVEEKTPDIVKKKLTGLDAWREKTALKLKEKTGELKEEIESGPSFIEAIKGPNKLKTLFQYAKLFGLQLLSFIFAHKFLFYLLLILLVLWLLRFVWRRLRDRD